MEHKTMELIIVDENGKLRERKLFLDETEAYIEAIRNNYHIAQESDDRLVVIEVVIH